MGEESLQQRIDQLETLLNLTSVLRPDLDAAELAAISLDAIGEAGHYAHGAIWFYENASTLSLSARRGAIRQPASSTIAASDVQQLIGACATVGGSYWLPVAAFKQQALARALTPPSDTAHLLFVPLLVMEPIGLVALCSPLPQPNSATVGWVDRFAEHISALLISARLVEERDLAMQELRAAWDKQSQLQRTITELSAPVLPLAAGVVLMPLVGAIDTQRIQQILESLLRTISQHRASVALLDITGLPSITTDTAMQLIGVTQSAQLLGCAVVLVGVRPAMAQTMVQLGISFEGLTTRTTLAEGLSEALRITGWQLRRS